MQVNDLVLHNNYSVSVSDNNSYCYASTTAMNALPPQGTSTMTIFPSLLGHAVGTHQCLEKKTSQAPLLCRALYYPHCDAAWLKQVKRLAPGFKREMI